MSTAVKGKLTIANTIVYIDSTYLLFTDTRTHGYVFHIMYKKRHPDNIIQNMKKARKNPDIFDAASWTNINIVELIYSLSLLRTNK